MVAGRLQRGLACLRKDTGKAGDKGTPGVGSSILHHTQAEGHSSWASVPQRSASARLITTSASDGGTQRGANTRKSEVGISVGQHKGSGNSPLGTKSPTGAVSAWSYRHNVICQIKCQEKMSVGFQREGECVLVTGDKVTMAPGRLRDIMEEGGGVGAG